VPVDKASTVAKPVGWASSIGLILLGIVACFLAAGLLSIATYPRFWIAAREALGLPAQIISIAFFTWGAISEEISKAFGAWSARPRTNRLSWWICAALIGATLGGIERILLWMNWTAEFQARFTPLAAVTYDSIAIVSHAALTVLSVSIALAMGGRWRGWCTGVIAAGALHAAHNLLPRFIDLGWTYAWTALSATIMLVILVTTFVLRDRISERTRLAAR